MKVQPPRACIRSDKRDATVPVPVAHAGRTRWHTRGHTRWHTPWRSEGQPVRLVRHGANFVIAARHRDRIRNFWARHRSLFWMLHSAWALITGALIAWFSHERYQLVGWVALALALTWASTLYFGRAASAGSVPPVSPDAARDPRRPSGETTPVAASAVAETPVAGTPVPAAPSLAHEVTSYVTRVMYQETLFFLLPFYAYSTVVRSPNLLFVVVLGALAAFSCIDLPFDRWLRTKPLFGFAFFAIVAFAALNLLLPLVFGLRVRFATPLAALLAIAMALPLAGRPAGSIARARLKLAAAALALAVITIGFPVLIPPAPLRMLSATFARGIDRESLALSDTLGQRTASSDAGGTLVVLVHVFAPTNLPATVHLVWRRDGTLLRTSRDVDVVAHTTGYRTWDSWRSPDGRLPAGRYQVVLETSAGRIIGEARIDITG